MSVIFFGKIFAGWQPVGSFSCHAPPLLTAHLVGFEARFDSLLRSLSMRFQCAFNALSMRFQCAIVQALACLAPPLLTGRFGR